MVWNNDSRYDESPNKRDGNPQEARFDASKIESGREIGVTRKVPFFLVDVKCTAPSGVLLVWR
jgi:hypothetical protein